MPFGFYIIMAAQFFSSLADNALLIAAIALLVTADAPSWLTPMLKLFFTISYVVLAPFVGAFADALPKGRVMLIANTIKIAGCLLMLTGASPLFAYAVVGLGAAAYSPAKYGILTEYLPHPKLVIANGWMEGLTVASIICGTMLGGVLISQHMTHHLHALNLPHLTSAPIVAINLIITFYAIAAVFNLYIPRMAIDHKPERKTPAYLVRDFWYCMRRLWSDKYGQVSLATTTVFWGAGATLQFVVLKWAEVALGYSLAQSSALQGITAIGIAIGAIIAARVPLNRAISVLPFGIAMGLVIACMVFVKNVYVAMAMMTLIGALGGYFVVPMNALLQHRGHVLMGAGHSIAVQNFNENISILIMLGFYALFVKFDFSIYTVIVLFGMFLTVTMMLVRERHAFNVRSGPLPALPTENGH